MFLGSALFSGTLLGLLFIVSGEINACEKQQNEIAAKLSETATKTKFLSKFVFTNDSKPGLQITWARPNSTTLIAITLASYHTTATVSDVYRSTDDGRSFSCITAQISPGRPLQLLTQLGLQRNPGSSSQLYLACAGNSDSSTNLHLSMDGGATWKLAALPFVLTEAFVFHETRPELALALSHTSLFITRDGGLNWVLLKDKVVKAAWGSTTDEANAIYVVRDGATAASASSSLPSVIRDSSASISSRLPRPSRLLLKTTDFGVTWRSLANNIYSYIGRANFIFVSLGESDGISRRLEVSTDNGTSFHRTSLPSIRPDSFASVLDVANGLAFVYVDSGQLNGYGTLYTSDASGRLFSKSLERYFYPPGGIGSDFYRVESMPGTYLTTMMKPDRSLRTLISHNRGANWEPLRAPAGAGDCLLGDKAGSDSCQLQLVSAYNMARGHPALLPISLASAPGLLVAHGNIGSSILQSSSSVSVYVSNNGGHSWSRALNGPHVVQLGNNGGFIAAVPYGSGGPQVIKFSTDAGRCWHSFKFTNEDYRFTGFVSEPGSRATSVAIWGYSSLTRHWRIFVIDFAAILTRECAASDYEPWLANGALSYTGNASQMACVFGAKQTIMRLKPDSLCANSYSYSPSKSAQPCNCTKEDFGCEFGYYREFSGRDCVRDPSVRELDVCTDEDSVLRIQTAGYRKLPGNLCSGGFAPNRTEQTALKGERCSQLLLRQRQRAEAAAAAKLKANADAAAKLAAELSAADSEAEANNRRRLLSILLPISAVLGGLICAVLALVLAAKLRERRRRLVAFHYSAVSAAGRREDTESAVVPTSSAPHLSLSSSSTRRTEPEDHQLLMTSTEDEAPADEASGSIIA